jgi:hypothetical protein
MDADQLRTLRQWADGLYSDDRPEVRAAAKAILLLVDEVEELRAALLSEMPHGSDAAATDEKPAVDAEGEPVAVEHALRLRLRNFARARLHRGS